jgi:hypothetical protein
MSCTSLVGLITSQKTNRTQEQVEFDVYDPWTGVFKYNAQMSLALYDSQFPNGVENPALVFLGGTMHDRPIMQDFLGTVNESDSLFKVYECKLLPCVPNLPAGFEEHVANSYGELILTTGAAEEGTYYLRSSGATFEAARNEDVGGEVEELEEVEEDQERPEDWFAQEEDAWVAAGGATEEEQEDWLAEPSSQIELQERSVCSEEEHVSVAREQQQPTRKRRNVIEPEGSETRKKAKGKDKAEGSKKIVDYFNKIQKRD